MKSNLRKILDSTDRSFSFCHLYMMYGLFFFSPCHSKRPPMINCIIEGLEITLLQTFYHSLAPNKICMSLRPILFRHTFD